MGYRKVNDDSLALVANAIREKGGTSEALSFPDGFSAAIMEIESGVELNFDVVAYETEAALLANAPAENTIGIITTTPISNWIFSPTQPENPDGGTVWISTDTSSPVEFNALKKNCIQVYLQTAKQYVSGAWEDVSNAKIYQNSEWVDLWDGILFENGNQYGAITGGWNGVVGNVIEVYPGTSGMANAHTDRAIDLRGKKTLYATVINTAMSQYGGTWAAALMLVSTKPASCDVHNDTDGFKETIIAQALTNTNKTISIPISDIDTPAYVVCTAHPAGGKGTFTKIWIE